MSSGAVLGLGRLGREIIPKDSLQLKKIIDLLDWRKFIGIEIWYKVHR